MNRDAFEKTSNIKHFINLCAFDSDQDEYTSERLPEYSLGFINGAWWMWQEQQKLIDELQLKVSEDSRILHNIINIERNKCDVLQARIDKALKVLLDSSPTMISKKAIKILKGGDE